MRHAHLAATLVLLASAAACDGKGGPTPPNREAGSTAPSPPPPTDPPKEAMPSAHAPRVPEGPVKGSRVLSARLISGHSPDSEADFAAMEKAGVKTVISVDGARPMVELAAKHGMRYVHVPHGYDGIPLAKQAELVKAFTTLDGPFYVHCHHGKHRGPAACAIGRMVLDKVSPEDCAAEMKAAGTDPKYRGLYAVPASFTMPSAEALAAVTELPSVAKVPGFQATMVHVDERWDHLKAVKKAGWKVPPESPDVVPSHEAVILAEAYRESLRSEDVAKKSEEFRKMLADAEAGAWALSKALEGTPDPAVASKAYDRAQASCATCHAKYRDNVRRW
jgi:protein tyrosine phosphatase (PTP) superfamily phosphohydrolase (DUF442 family)